MDPDEYVSYCGTHCDHIVIPEPMKTAFFEGLREAVAENGGKVIFKDTYVLYLARKCKRFIGPERPRRLFACDHSSTSALQDATTGKQSEKQLQKTNEKAEKESKQI
jgi:hypothetical protein